ncbi:hypothetical protein IQ268_10885 [Oculatella sp. LEGE 06141]|uniref:hypothetical protein n=1 Tax=Oculatella sp. LEGE 06141 TaxID=1828648 RepID=UPI0018814A7B|nr:hypothetical protein [Oculatella sp. LEGE 06141]MBE9179066.1 hypothetical protein [Oculatella sp. LEGE 06141]
MAIPSSRHRYSKPLASGLALLCGLAIALSLEASVATPIDPAPPVTEPSQGWRQMTSEERSQTLTYILNSPLGVAALNQLAIEGFISPTCTKTYYTNDTYSGFQTLLRVICPTERGVSIATSYAEMRVTFNRFEDSIESFNVERVHAERSPDVTLPD